MIVTVIADFINILGTVLTALIIIRAIMSWFAAPGGELMRILVDVTEPILAPIRRVLPPMGGLDLSPILALVAIYIIEQVALSLLPAA